MVRYEIEISQEARAQIKALPRALRRNIGRRLDSLQDGLTGDVKKLSVRENAYRLRVGTHRVLFLLDAGVIQVYAVKDRKDAYV